MCAFQGGEILPDTGTGEGDLVVCCACLAMHVNQAQDRSVSLPSGPGFFATCDGIIGGDETRRARLHGSLQDGHNSMSICRMFGTNGDPVAKLGG